MLADAPKSHMDGVIEATEFNVFKVKQNKVAEVSKFYDAFVAAIKTLNGMSGVHYLRIHRGDVQSGAQLERERHRDGG